MSTKIIGSMLHQQIFLWPIFYQKFMFVLIKYNWVEVQHSHIFSLCEKSWPRTKFLQQLSCANSPNKNIQMTLQSKRLGRRNSTHNSHYLVSSDHINTIQQMIFNHHLRTYRTYVEDNILTWYSHTA